MLHRSRSRSVALAAAALSLAVAGGTAAQSTPGTTQPGTPGLGPAPWPQRAITAFVAGRSVSSDLGPGRTERWIAAVVAAEEMVAALLGTDSLLARATPARELLLFADREDYERVLRGRYGVVEPGGSATTFLFEDARITAATTPPPPPPPAAADGHATAAPASAPAPAPAEVDLAAAAAELLDAAAAASFDRPFESDLPPALAAGIRLFAAESLVIDGGVFPGHPQAETFVAAQVVLRDRSPDLVAILGVDQRDWEDLAPEAQADATLATWSLVQFASTREGRDAVPLLRELAARINAGDRPATAVARAAAPQVWRRVLDGWRRWLSTAAPDPTAEVVFTVEALAAGLRELAADGVVPTDLGAAATALADRGFTWRAVRQGVPVSISVTGPDTFVLPEDTGTGRRPEIELVRPRSTGRAAGEIPPGIDVRGTRLGRLMVEWDRTEDGPVRRMVVR